MPEVLQGPGLSTDGDGLVATALGAAGEIQVSGGRGQYTLPHTQGWCSLLASHELLTSESSLVLGDFVGNPFTQFSFQDVN